MSDAALKRIEKALSKLSRQQEDLCTRIDGLEQRIADPGGPTRDETIRFLDEFRAGEALGEASLGAWIEVSDTPCVRGGLRTIQMREGMHARLLEQRIKELGGAASFEVPDAVQETVLKGAASAETSDADKVKAFVAQFPDVDKALERLTSMADRLENDRETQSLLRTIAQDERSTLVWLAEACALLNPS